MSRLSEIYSFWMTGWMTGVYPRKYLSLIWQAIWHIIGSQMAYFISKPTGVRIMILEKTLSTASPNLYTLEKLLGLKSADNLQLAKKVEAGFSFDALEKLGKQTGLPLDKLRVAIRITPRTLTRRRKENRLSPEESDRLVSVSRLLAKTLELFEGNKEAAHRWFTNPNRALGTLSPLEAAATETGSREVENLIGRLEHGVFT